MGKSRLEAPTIEAEYRFSDTVFLCHPVLRRATPLMMPLRGQRLSEYNGCVRMRDDQ
jgi:hypothetical protein